MFILHRSANTEILLTHLVTVITSTPLSSPFKKETLLVEQPSMERWLSQQLASQLKVWGNYQFLSPDRFFNNLAQKINAPLNECVLNQEMMRWQCESALRGNLNKPELWPLKAYLSGSNIALKRYQLACKLAHLFNQYQRLRPDMLKAWQQDQLIYDNAIERWQKALWQYITGQQTYQNKADNWLDAIATLKNTHPDRLIRHLPERLLVFGICHIAPLMLDFLQALALHCQVHFFLLTPLLHSSTPLDDTAKTQHPLLASLGQQAYELQHMLQQRGLWQAATMPHSQQKVSTVLQHLQHAIVHTTPLAVPHLPQDNSISTHACHSRLREIEVLRNQLLNALEQDRHLELRDIIVMAPDIQPYIPFISAVFNDIPHSFAEHSMPLSHRLVNTFVDFLQLSQSRLGWQSVVDLLEQPCIFASFDLIDTDLDLIKQWIINTRVRWGQSSQHRQTLDLFPCEENTWQALLNRLLMGYAVGTDSEFVNDILPYKDIEGSSAQALGGLHDFLQLLFDASHQFKQPMPLADWGMLLYRYADQLLAAAEATERQHLNELLLTLTTMDTENHPENITLQVIIAWLQEPCHYSAQQEANSGLLRGQLTFCSLHAVRLIPFKVTALIGMNEGDFPRQEQPLTFDLLRQETREGDTSRRATDRYHFLEILLSTRQQLIITFIGQSIKYNTAIAPSLVVSELLDVLRSHYLPPPAIIKHPLHAFSTRYFKGTEDLFSFSSSDCETARALSQPKIEPAIWWQGYLSPAENTVLALSDVFRFFKHPQRHFMQQQLAVRFYGIEPAAQEREAFTLDTLDTYITLNQGIEDRLQNIPLSVKKYQAEGRWLSGIVGELEAQRQNTLIEDFVARLAALQLGEKREDIAIDILCGTHRVLGTLGHCYDNGSLFYRYAPLKSKDFVSAVLYHLIINQVQAQTTYLLSTDEQIVLLPEHCQDDYLNLLLNSYQQGQQCPHAFFTEPLLVYLQQACKAMPHADALALDKAAKHLASSIKQPHELALNRLFGAAVDLHSLLEEHCEPVYKAALLPLWHATHRTKVVHL